MPFETTATRLPLPVQDAEQAFDNGRMLWRADTLTIYMLYEEGPLKGTYRTVIDTWREGDPVYSCAATPPPGRVQPRPTIRPSRTITQPTAGFGQTLPMPRAARRRAWAM